MTTDSSESIVWSKVESAIAETEADVLLIFDCCNAGRLARPLRDSRPKSYFQFLGACSADSTTMGPGEQSFTSALIWSLEELAKLENAFSTAELRDKIMEYEPFKKTEQIPVLSERRPPYEHIVISRKDLSPSKAKPAPTSSEREQDWQHKEYIDLRFQFDHKIGENDVQDTATALKRINQVWKPGTWSRVTFRGKSSIAEDVTKLWRSSTKESASRKSFSNTSLTAPEGNLGDQVASPEVEQALSLRTPGLTPARSDQPAASPTTPVGEELASNPVDKPLSKKRAFDHRQNPRQLRSKSKKRRDC